MKPMKALKSFRIASTGEFVALGKEFEVDPRIADQYERNGMAVPSNVAKATIAKVSTGPFVPGGGQTGADKPQSSSPAVQAQPKPTLTLPNTQKSSPSTRDTASQTAPTSSMDVMGHGGRQKKV